MNWVENVAFSIPDHSKDIRFMLTKIMKTKNLSEVDAHACALAAALTSGNGDLGFAIEMFGPLKRASAEIKAVKSAASLANMRNIYYKFIEQTEQVQLKIDSSGIDCSAEKDCSGVPEEKFLMYSLAASVVNYAPAANTYVTKLMDQYNMSSEAIQDIAKIAAVINTIGKIAPEIDQLVPSAGYQNN